MKLQGQGLNYKGKNHVKLSLTNEDFNKLKFSEGLIRTFIICCAPYDNHHLTIKARVILSARIRYSQGIYRIKLLQPTI